MQEKFLSFDDELVWYAAYGEDMNQLRFFTSLKELKIQEPYNRMAV